MSSPTPNEAPKPFSPTPRPMSCGRCGCMVAIVLVTLLVIGIIGLRMFIISQFGPERMARLRAYDAEVVAIPQAWQEPVPLPSDEVVEFQFKFYDDMARVGAEFSSLLEGGTTDSAYWKLHHNEPVTADEQQQINELVEALSPIIAETSASVELPQYTAEMMLYSSGTQFLQVQQFTKLSSIVAIETVRRGDCRTAMDIAALPIRYTRHEKPATLTLEIMRIACTQIAMGTFQVVAERCNDRATLDYGLELLHQLREEAQPLTLAEVRLTDSISMLNRAKAFGYPTNLSPQTWSEVTRQTYAIYSAPYNEWAVQHFPADDRRHQHAQEILDKTEERGGSGMSALWSAEWIPDWMTSGMFGVSFGAILADIAIPHYDEVLYRSKAMLANYDLTRVYLAQRLTQLEGGADATAGVAQVTAYLQTIPPDPFSSGTLLFQRDTNKFYSIGPDKKDDAASIPYDPTNGTISHGDIFLPRR